MRVISGALRTGLYQIRHFFILILCIAGISLTAMAFPGDLDLGFGTGGKVLSSPEGANSTSGRAIALQTDGKIVMAGSGANLGFVVARYNTDGSIDLTFGGGDGWTAVTFGYTQESAVSVAIQADGKIVIGGTLITPVKDQTPIQDFGIARLNSDGTLDTAFDSDGKAIVPFNEFNGSFYREFLTSLKIAPDGKIVAAGQALDNGPFLGRFLLARLNTDGSPDTNFGSGGTVISPTIVQFDFLNDITILPDGAIAAAGRSNTVATCTHIVRKYNAGGGTEWTYTQAYQAGGAISYLNAIAAQPDGKFIVAGDRSSKVFVLRLNSNGTVDNSFADTAGMPTGEVTSLALQTDGKIVAVVNTSIFGGSNGKFTVMRFNTGGPLDIGFGAGGIVNTTLVANASHSGDVLIQPDGKVLVGGSVTGGSASYFAMVRYTGGTFTAPKAMFDYDGDGRADISLFRPSNGNWYLSQSQSGFSAQNFGINGDVITPGDFDDDDRTDLGVFRPSTGVWWYKSSLNDGFYAVQWGGPGDIPLAEDFNGDGTSDFVIFRPANSTWYRLGTNGDYSPLVFGTTGDIPLVADMDGDGKADPTIYRPSTGTWWYASSVNGGFYALQWGTATDIPVPGDYDADGKTDPAYFRPSNGAWYIVFSGTGYTTHTAVSWGTAGDRPVAADYDGDGKTDVAIYRPSNAMWFIIQSTGGTTGMNFGLAGDEPTPNAFVP